MVNTPADLREMHVVVIEDEPPNRLILQRYLEDAGFSQVTSIGESAAAIETMSRNQPDVIVLDLHMPGEGGLSVLENIRTDCPAWNKVPILTFASNLTRESRQRALELGANDVLSKPIEAVEIVLKVRNFLRIRQLSTELEELSLDLEGRVRVGTEELANAAEDCLWRLARASDCTDDESGEHTLRVGVLSGLIAERLGEPDDGVEMIRRAAPLHDIGKISIPDTILLKPGKLTEDEYDVVRQHVKVGSSLLAGSSSKLMRLAEKIALTHHEKWDGTGYLQGLSGEDIPLPGRIVAVADVFDALTHDRPYKQAWPTDRAVEEIKSLSGTHFDPAVVDAFLEVIDGYETQLAV